ncbi:MAG: hypothetical protein L3J38_05635 [Thiomicrorhabdus sp.]|nr:hypothetical protein [Thiomicrorhabdus sp.]
MLKQVIVVWALLSVSLIPVSVMAQSVKVNKVNPPPFLITQNLPHLVKELKKHWDNPLLGLSQQQKSELLVIRKETIQAVNTLSAKIAPLEKQVSEGIFSHKTPEMLQSLVKQISELKMKATMVHLNCIFKTKQALSAQQFQFLLENR